MTNGQTWPLVNVHKSQDERLLHAWAGRSRKKNCVHSREKTSAFLASIIIIALLTSRERRD